MGSTQSIQDQNPDEEESSSSSENEEQEDIDDDVALGNLLTTTQLTNSTNLFEDLKLKPSLLYDLNITNPNLIKFLIAMERVGNQILNTETLNMYGTDVTLMAKEGKLDPVIGRESETERIIQILGKKRKNCPCLIGDPGVGKTRIVEGLAMKIVTAAVPDELKDKKVFALKTGRLIAGAAHRVNVEERFKKVVDEVKQSKGSIILFIDDLHTLVDAAVGGYAVDATSILEPELAQSDLKCICTTTHEELRKYTKKYDALKQHFQPVEVPEPSAEQAIQILKGLSAKYEAHHDVKYEFEALVAAVNLSKQYISDRFLPDKAIDLIDEAGAKLHLQKSKTPSSSRIVTEDDIRQIISTWTGIPVEKVTVEESRRLLNFEKDLGKHVIGQDEAVEAISRAIRRARVGLRDPNRPIASFFFTGPTGVGKTELSNAVALEFFGSKEAMIRLDMSEYMESHSVSKLFGSPPGYIAYDEGGQLSEAVRHRAHTVILFDEIEKAHKDVYDVLLQILDNGNMTDAKGLKVDFKNTIIIMTSNIGQDLIFEHNSPDQVNLQINEVLKKNFRPEFLNRIDEVIVFKKLEKVQLKQIVEVMLKEVYQRAKAKNISIEVSEKFKEKLIQEGYNQRYGVRPLRRAVVRLLEDSLAERILKGDIRDGDSVTVDVDSLGNAIFLLTLASKEIRRRSQRKAKHPR